MSAARLAAAGMTLDIGDNLLQAIITIVGLIGLYIAQRKGNRDAAQAAKQSVPNGGSSMRDAIDRIEAAVNEQSLRLGAVQERVAVLEHPAIVTGDVPVVPLVLGQTAEATTPDPPPTS